jgi:hypothetical protein
MTTSFNPTSVINEGLTEKMWPRISQKIEEEAYWAFFS